MESEVWARFAEAIGTAFHNLATDLRAQRRSDRPSDTPAPATPATGIDGRRLGVRERQVASLFARLGATGELTAREIADGIGGYDQANIYFPIRTLVDKGLLEEVPGAKPRKWRATGRLLAA
jgi:hypothetical protein